VVNSTAAARLNGYFGGYGSDDVLREEIESYGLSDEGKKALIYVTGRKIGGYKQ